MPSPLRLSCRVEVRGDGVHLIVSGELDHHTGKQLDLALGAVLTGRPDTLVLDLSTVEWMSAEGTAVLVDAMHRAATVCASVTVVPSRPVRQRLAALGLGQALIAGPDPVTEQAPPAESA